MKKSVINNYSIQVADIEDVDKIKYIADKNGKQLGFVVKNTIIQGIERKELLVAKQDNIVLGFINYHKKQDNITTIYELAVDFRYRHKGIAKALINKISKPIELKCPINNESNEFYKKIGFILKEVIQGKKQNLNLWEYK